MKLRRTSFMRFISLYFTLVCLLCSNVEEIRCDKVKLGVPVCDDGTVSGDIFSLFCIQCLWFCKWVRQ